MDLFKFCIQIVPISKCPNCESSTTFVDFLKRGQECSDHERQSSFSRRMSKYFGVFPFNLLRTTAAHRFIGTSSLNEDHTKLP